jgi:hypothetical protein
MPRSSTERFARTYTPRIPDDSYDCLGGTDILDSVIRAPMERPFEQVVVHSTFANGLLVHTLVLTGQTNKIKISTGFTSGAIQTSGIRAPVQHDSFQLTVSMAGGTLH